MNRFLTKKYIKFNHEYLLDFLSRAQQQSISNERQSTPDLQLFTSLWQVSWQFPPQLVSWFESLNDDDESAFWKHTHNSLHLTGYIIKTRFSDKFPDNFPLNKFLGLKVSMMRMNQHFENTQWGKVNQKQPKLSLKQAIFFISLFLF